MKNTLKLGHYDFLKTPITSLNKLLKRDLFKKFNTFSKTYCGNSD